MQHLQGDITPMAPPETRAFIASKLMYHFKNSIIVLPAMQSSGRMSDQQLSDGHDHRTVSLSCTFIV